MLLPQTFHPIIRDWFTETWQNPTSVQEMAWPLIENGGNVLAIAPTGSGKTLTAFLSAISRFCAADKESKYDAEKLSVLYVSPLKALNEDIKRNLLEPLAAIKRRFEKEELVFPPVRVETRSGDTPQSHRRRFFIHPPSILALTPESLSILLLNPKGRKALSSVKCLIIDEIHALLGNKRGAFLSCQIDRLALIAGDFQRISLSATIRDPQSAAEFTGDQVNIVAPKSEKKIELIVEYPEIEIDESRINKNNNGPSLPGDYSSHYTPLINYVLSRVREGSTILVFAESRRRVERLCYFINQIAMETMARNDIAFPHHGSLSKELRRGVEKGLVEGRIPCVVATASLELGIDIGYVDEVVLAGSPANVSQALQRVGRSGHGVGRTSRGRLFAFHSKDLLLAAALKDAVDERDIEEIHPIVNPLDILAQLVLSLCAEKNWKTDEIFDLIKKFHIFKSISYDSFNRVVHMLSGVSTVDFKSRLRDVKPRIWFDKTEETIGALDGTTTLLYTSGGVIANRGLFSIRIPDGTKIGELDEVFVWERSVGDCFDFGARGWRITNITAEAVEVSPLENRANNIPFWIGDTVFRSSNLTKRIMATLENFNKSSDIQTSLTPAASEALKTFLQTQSAAQNHLPLPDINNITVEIISGGEINRDFSSIVLHSFRGGQINYPFSLALAARMSEMTESRIESFSNDDNILFLLPRLGSKETSFNPREIFLKALAALDETDSSGVSKGERLFRNRLEISGVFGAAFREAAQRSMLLPKSPFGRRTPLWITRQRSKRLFDAVAGEDGFPVTMEAWRSCLVDTFDMEGFRDLIASLNNGSIALSFFDSVNPSPFSKDIVRQETITFIYEYDERRDLAGKNYTTTLSDKVIEEAVGDFNSRPALKKPAIDEFVSKLRREISGWAPEDSLSLNEWIKERVAIPMDEWEILRGAMSNAAEINIDEDKIKTVTRNGAITSLVHREWEEDWKNNPLNLLGQWLRYQGPVSIERIRSVFGVTEAEARDAVDALAEVDEVIRDVAVTDGETDSLLICDRENLEILLRLSRKKGRPVIKERPVSTLAPFLAIRQGLTESEGFVFRKNLYAWTAPAKLWETEILPARNPDYNGENLDREIREGQLVWYGDGNERIGFCGPEDLDLKSGARKNALDTVLSPLLSSEFFDRPRDFWEIKNAVDAAKENDIRSCARSLWDEVWNGSLTSDSLDPIRRGIENGFIPKETSIPVLSGDPRPFGRQPRVPSALRNRWKSGAPIPGNWFSLIMEAEEADPIAEDAINKDRVRLLLDRWGVLCRPLLERETDAFSWSKLLPAMRRMELAGELVAGRFFSGVNSLQFASVSIARELERAENFTGIYWMNAADPASLAGLEIDGLDYPLCARSVNNRLYYRGAGLIAVSAKNGKELKINIEARDPDMERLISLLKTPRARKVLPENKILVEKINGETAAKSVYAPRFQNQGFISDRGKLICW